MMPSIPCGSCDTVIVVWPQKPFRIVQEDGKPAIPTDYTPVYEHIRDKHPEQWTDAMESEFKQHREPSHTNHEGEKP